MRFRVTICLTISLCLATATHAAELVFKDKSGRVITMEDLKNASGKFDWEVRAGKPVPQEAIRLHELGRASGRNGNNKAAIEYFEKAAKVAPDWPYPLYDAAFAYLLTADFERAYDLYKKVDVMAPRGFFTAKTAVYSLKGEMNGDFPKGTYLYFLSLEWETDSSKKLQIIENLLAKAPKFAPAWKAKAALENNDEKRLNFLEMGLKVKPDPETKGFLLINKALMLHRLEKNSEAIEILGNLVLDPASPLDIETIAKKTLATVIARD